MTATACLCVSEGRAGLLLYAIVQRYRYAKATLAGIEGTWSTNPRSVWYEAAALRDSQGGRALQKLDSLGLIERASGPWRGSLNLLHVRPTERTQQVWHAITFQALYAALAA